MKYKMLTMRLMLILALVLLLALAGTTAAQEPEPATAGEPEFVPAEPESVPKLNSLGLRALLYHFDSFDAGPFLETQMVNTGLFSASDIDIVGGGTFPTPPSLAFLQQYDCVIVWTNYSPANAVAHGDLLKQYVDTGGRVVLATYAYSRNITPWEMQGGIMQTGYSPLVNSNTSLTAFPRSLDFSTANTAHPMLAGVTDFTYGGNYNYTQVSLDPGALLVGSDNFGVPLLAINSSGRVAGMNVYPGPIFYKSPGVFRTIANACNAVSNQPPTADPNGPYYGDEGSPVTFDGTGSSDPDGDPLTYDWDFGDGSPIAYNAGPTPSHTYDDNGVYDICLTVTDPGGLSDTQCASTKPMDVVFALDSSGSMSWNDPGGLRKTAAKSFVDKMDSSQDTAGVVSWDSYIDFTYPLSSDFPTVKWWIDQVDSSGGTNLDVGLNAAISLLDSGKQAGASWVIIFLSNGEGSYTPAASGGPAAVAASRGYVIYSIGLGPSPATWALMDMANATGGQFYPAPTAENLQAIFDDIYVAVTGKAFIANVAPTATFNAPTDVDEGDDINLSLTGPYDPSNADTLAGFEYAFDCGDGGGYGAWSSTDTAICPTDDNGTRTVKGKIRDKDGGETEYTAAVTIHNVPPTATFNAPTYVIAGDAFDLSLTDPYDPSSADTAAGFEYDFDCGGGYDGWSADNTATCSTSPGEIGDRTVKGKIKDKDGGETEYTATVTILPPSAATDSALCYYDREPEIDGQQFRLIFTPDMQLWPAYKLPASNPGQFFYNVFYTGEGPADFSITVPEPFETQGAMPVHVYTGVSVGEINGFKCFVPDLDSEIYVGDFSGLSGLSDPGGFLYVTVHMDYGLKGTTGYIPNFNNDALDAETEEVLIPNLGDYTFSVSGSQSDSRTIQNVNDFKKIPGFGGLVTDGEGDPVAGATAVITLDGAWLGEATTDEDGWYMLVYKHTGKPADYTVELPEYSLSETGTLKANKFAEVNFVVE